MSVESKNMTVASPISTDENSMKTTEIFSAVKPKPLIIGLYGPPGAGKTHLLKQLQKELPDEFHAFYNGSQAIADVTPGGLDAFKAMEKPNQDHWRKIAIDTIAKNCLDNSKMGIVAGHFMFWWNETDAVGEMICTESDLNLYSHILYLDVPADIIKQRHDKDKADSTRKRAEVSISHLVKWMEAEKKQLRNLCYKHGILFSVLSSHIDFLPTVSKLLQDFHLHNETQNLSLAQDTLENFLGVEKRNLDTMLVFDADRTLAAEDAGKLFWDVFYARHPEKKQDDPLKKIFVEGYSYTTFRQAMLLFEESCDEEEYEMLCHQVASEISMYPEVKGLLKRAVEHDKVGAVVITCGLRRVWEIVLGNEGFAEKVKVIGGGRISDGFVVTAVVKGALVSVLQDKYHFYIWAFGDSLVDLEMLCKADKAILIVGSEETRTRTIDAPLKAAIDNNCLRVHQAVIPDTVSPRLNTTKLPLINLMSPTFLTSIFSRPKMNLIHATDKPAAKLLMTPTRNAKISGPALREAHRHIGWYLATEYLTSIIGTEEYPIPHVQDTTTPGHRLLHESKTLVIPLMRGGEPMALGINDAFPQARFFHAKNPEDLEIKHLEGIKNVVVVDSVVNSGKSVVEFVERVKGLRGDVRVVVVAGVVQKGAVAEGGKLERVLGGHSLVALRLSENKYTGSRGTDTGNRLFNTTHLA